MNLVLKTKLLILSVVLVFFCMKNEESLNMTDCYGLDDNDLPNDSFPLIYSLINCEQQQDETLI
jgi:hypothetical protein